MSAILTMALKDIRLLIRDKTGFFFTFFFPLIIALFFGTIFSGGGGGTGSLALLVVDEDMSDESREFIGHLKEADEVRIQMATREEAVEKVRLGSAPAYVVLLSGFGSARKNLFQGYPPEIELGVDPARKATAGMLHGILMNYSLPGFQKAFTDQALMREHIRSFLPVLDEPNDLNPKTAHHYRQFLTELDTFMEHLDETAPGDSEFADVEGFSGFQPLIIRNTDIIRERKGPQSGYDISFPQGIIWGIIGCAAAFSISLVVERTHGTLIRLRIAPVSMIQILAGKALGCFLTTLAISCGLLLLAIFFFQVKPDSIPLLAMAILSICAGFVGIMMLLSVLGRTEQAAGGIGWAVLLVMSMLGGGMIPLFIMPVWLQNISHISPVKWAMLAMEGAIWRQFTFVEMLLPCGIILGVGLLCFTIGVRVFRFFD